MRHPVWPLFDLRLRTGALELRLPTDDDIVALADLARNGIHPREEMPFAFAWTDLPSPEFEERFARFHWGLRANWEPERWTLDFAVLESGTLVGMQGLGAERFAVRRTVSTGSWLGRSFQGRGIGTLMRQAVLALSFDHLGAEIAESGAFLGNPASARVSESVGYEPNGLERLAPRGVPHDLRRYRLTAERWRARPRPRVGVEGLDACLRLFGVDRSG